MTIRAMTLDDYEQVYELWACMRRPRNKDDSRASVQRFLQRNPGLSVVAEANGKVVGAALCGHDGRRGFLYRVAVDPTQRRLGLGQAMVQACLTALQQEGISVCAIDVFVDNHEGRAFWPAQGFSLWEGQLIYLKELPS